MFYQKVGKPEEKLWLSTNVPKKTNIAQKIKKLISPTFSKKTQQSSDKKNYLLVRDQTAEFLKKNQYLIHEEEMNLKTIHILPGEGVNETTCVSKVSADQFSVTKDIVDQASPSSDAKTKKTTSSKIKSFMSGSPKQPADKNDHELIKKQTTQFLEDLKRYNNKEYELSSKSKIAWISEMSPPKGENILEKKTSKQIFKERRSAESNGNSETDLLIKKLTGSFLKDHKDYHDKQRVEDNTFYQKVGKPEEKLWLSTNVPTKTNMTQKIKRLISPTFSKKPQQPVDKKTYLLVRDQTAEFLKKNQYLIHEEEINLKSVHNLPGEAANHKTCVPKVSANQLHVTKDIVNQTSPSNKGKTKKTTFSKIESLMSGSPKQPADKNDHNLIKQQTSEFLEDSKIYNNKEYEISSKSKIVWISETSPPKDEDILGKNVFKERRSAESNDNSEVYLLNKKLTDSFLRDHKDYHDKQRVEDNMFYDKVGKPEEKLWLSNNVPKKTNIAQKIKKLISPTFSKKPKQSTDERTYLLVRDQTAEFLKKNQYLIHEEEINLKTAHNLPGEAVDEKTCVSKVSANQLSGAKDKVNQTPPDNIGKQKNCTFQVPSEKSKKDIRGSENVGNVRESAANLYLIEQTASFLNDHKDYHDKQRNESEAFFQKECASKEQNCLPSHTPNPKSITNKIKKLFSQPNTKESLIIYDDLNDQYIREKTTEFINKHQYFIHKEEVNFKTISNSSESINKINIPKTNTNKAPMKTDRIKKNTISKLKSAISGTTKQNHGSNFEMISAQTSEFLENARKYNDIQHGTSLKMKISWLSDETKISQNQNEVPLKKISSELEGSNSEANNKCDASSKSKVDSINECKSDARKYNEKFQKQNCENVNIEKATETNNSEYKSYFIIKQNTDTFLKDHKNYHDRQRIEDNKFFEKIGKPGDKFWLSSTIPNKNTLTHKIKKLFSPTIPKKPHHSSNEKSYLLMKDKTAEFLEKNQYLIHEEEVNVKAINDTVNSKVTVNQLSGSKTKIDQTSPSNIKKVKNSKFSKIKSLMSGSQKQSPTESDHKLIIQQTAKFLENMKIYNYNEYNATQKHNIIWLSEREIIPHKVEKANISTEVIRGNKSEDNNTDYQKPHSAKNNVISKEKTDRLDTQAKKNDCLVDNKAEEPFEPFKGNDDAIEMCVPLVSNGQKQPQTMKKKVTFSDYRDATDKEIDNFKKIKQQTQQFLKRNQDYHNVQWSDYIGFQKPNNKAGEIDPPNKTTKISPTLSRVCTPSLNAPREIDNRNDENASQELEDSSEEFLQKQQYLIDEKINQNNIKPKPTPRKSKANTEKLVKQNYPSEEYLLMRKGVLLFLQDHQTYHNRERTELINFASNQMKHLGKLPKPNATKESKTKSKLISKLKSFVGGSTELFSPDKKDNEPKKQTAEFLISQKCFWDLQKSAELTFMEKKEASKKYNEGAVKTLHHLNKTPEKASIPMVKEKKDVKQETLSSEILNKIRDNLTPPQHKKNQKEDYESVKKHNELFLNNHQIYHDSQMRDFIAFSVSRKQNHNESQIKDINDKNIIPQHSSSYQKTLEKDNSKKNKINLAVQTEEKGNDVKSIQNMCEIFLNAQRSYNDSANEGWRRYIMYKPEVAVLKKNVSKNKSEKSKKPPSPKRNTKIKNPQHSVMESQKIDYEVNLHKTKLFLEDLKKYHDNLQNELANYAPKNIYRNDISEPQTNEKKDGVLGKIKSMLPSNYSKNSYNVQKAKLSSHNQRDITKTESIPIVTKFVGSPEFTDSKIQSKDVSEIILREQTDMFLKDHQNYHNRQHNDFIKYFVNKEKEIQILAEEEGAKIKKGKKSMMSKIKSLLGSDPSKKPSNKKTGGNDDFFKTPTRIFLDDQKQYSHLEKSAEKIFDDSRGADQLKHLENHPTDSTDSVAIVEKVQKEPFIQSNDQHIELKNKNHQKRKEYLANKTSIATKEEEYNTPVSRSEKTNLKQTPVTDRNTTELSNLSIYDDERSDRVITPLLTSEIRNVADNERKKYARERLQTHEFLLNQKEFNNAGPMPYSNSLSKPPKSAMIETKSVQNVREGISKMEDENVDIISTKSTHSYQNDAGNMSSHNSENITKVKGKPISPTNGTEDEKNNIDFSLIQRVERPMSPTKTIFREIRTRDNNPDNKVYILSEGYTITREAFGDEKNENICPNTNYLQKTQLEPKHKKHVSQENIGYSVFTSTDPAASEVKLSQTGEILRPPCLIGQDSSSDNNEYSPSQQISRVDSEARQHTKRRTYREMEEEPRSFITEARVETNGKVTQRYSTSCYFHQVPTAVWYSESLIVDLEENSQKMNEKVYYDNLLLPDYWSETFETEVTSKENMFVSEVVIPISQESADIHYISLEHQQVEPQNVE